MFSIACHPELLHRYVKPSIVLPSSHHIAKLFASGSLFAHVISCTYCLSTGSFPPHCLR